jgi:hypothetical protein
MVEHRSIFVATIPRVWTFRYRLLAALSAAFELALA